MTHKAELIWMLSFFIVSLGNRLEFIWKVPRFQWETLRWCLFLSTLESVDISCLSLRKVIMPQFKRKDEKKITFVIQQNTFLVFMSLYSKIIQLRTTFFFQTMLCNWIIYRLCKLLIMFINLNMKLVMHYSEKAESAFKATLRKISCALKAERDVGNWRGRWGAGPSHFFANQIPYLKKGSRLCPKDYCSLPLDFQTFRHLYLFSHGYRS